LWRVFKTFIAKIVIDSYFCGKIRIMKEAKDCQDIWEVREIIDEIDYQILESFGKRLKCVEAIVKFKTDTDSIVAKERQLEVFQKRREWAKEFGLDPNLITEIYEKLITWNIRKELEIFKTNENSL